MSDDLPDTSRKAREDNAPRRETQHYRIIAAIESEAAGLTRSELVLRTGLPEGTVNAGVNALVRGDWIEDTVKMRPTSTGSQARVLVVLPGQWRWRVLVEAVAEHRRPGESARDALLRVGWVTERNEPDSVTDDADSDPRRSSVLLTDDELRELETVAAWIAEARESSRRGGTPTYRKTYTVISDALDGLRWLVSPEAVRARTARARARKRRAGLSITAGGKAVLAQHEPPAGVFDGNER